MGKKILEGLWDCPYCGQRGIGGLTKTCPNCAHPQDKTTIFYLGTEKRYLDSETAKQYGKGADWVCSFCGSMNRCHAAACANCGASREDAEGDYFANEKRLMEEGQSTPSSEEPASKGAGTSGIAGKSHQAANRPPRNPNWDHEAFKARQRENRERLEKEIQKKQHQQNREKKRRRICCGAILLLLLAGFLYSILPKEYSATVDKVTWERNIPIETYQTVEENDWSVPNGGRVLEKKREVHHYEKVLDHYETVRSRESRSVLDGYDTETTMVNNGDGTFTEETTQVPRYRTEYYIEYSEEPVYREEPVYQTKYYYEIERWVHTDDVRTGGTKADAPYWGEVRLKKRQREGKRTQRYILTLTTEEEKEYTADLPQKEWKTFSPGDDVTITVKSGKVIKVNDIELK